MTIRGWWNRQKRKRGRDAEDLYCLRDKVVCYAGRDAVDEKLFHQWLRVNFSHVMSLGTTDPFFGFVEVREWLHHNAGYRWEQADPMFGEYHIHFHDQNDAFAFRMRFAGSEYSHMTPALMVYARQVCSQHGLAEFSG